MPTDSDILRQIQQDILGIRHELDRLRTDLERAGLVAPNKKPMPTTVEKWWAPPVLQRLGDMVRIIAQSNPASAAVLNKEQPGKDPEWDPMKDVKDADPNNDRTRANDTDPNKKDLRNYFWGTADYNVGNWKGDRKADVKPPKTDDNDSENHYRPDLEGPADGV